MRGIRGPGRTCALWALVGVGAVVAGCGAEVRAERQPRYSIKWRVPDDPRSLKELFLDEDDPESERALLLALLADEPAARADALFALGVAHARAARTTSAVALWQHALDAGLRGPRAEALGGGQHVAVLPIGRARSTLHARYPALASASPALVQTFLLGLVTERGVFDARIGWWDDFAMSGPEAILYVGQEAAAARAAAVIGAVPAAAPAPAGDAGDPASRVRASCRFVELPAGTMVLVGERELGAIASPRFADDFELHGNVIAALPPEAAALAPLAVGPADSRAAAPGEALQFARQEAVNSVRAWGQVGVDLQGLVVRLRCLPISADKVAVAFALEPSIAYDGGTASNRFDDVCRVLERGRAYLITGSRTPWRGVGDAADPEDRPRLAAIVQID